MNEITRIETLCRFMWILQDQDGNEVRHSAGVGGIPESMKQEAKASDGRLEIWAEHYNLIGRVGKELGYVPLDNDVRMVEVKMGPRPEYGRKERIHYWLTPEWAEELEHQGRDPWTVENGRCTQYAREFLNQYLVRTRTETFRGTLHECEDWMIARRFPMLDQERWDIAMNGGVAEWPGRPGELPELSIERIR